MLSPNFLTLSPHDMAEVLAMWALSVAIFGAFVAGMAATIYATMKRCILQPFSLPGRKRDATREDLIELVDRYYARRRSHRG